MKTTMGRGADYYRKYREERKAASRAWYLSHADSERAKARLRIDEWKTRDPEGYKASCRANYQRNRINCRRSSRKNGRALREELFSNYGSICTCCGETEKTFLSLEHLNGDGYLHRKKFGNGVCLYIHLKRMGWPKAGYTILCMNCNTGKYRNGGVCPHVVKKTAAMLMPFLKNSLEVI